jgi:hypothetical protein
LVRFLQRMRAAKALSRTEQIYIRTSKTSNGTEVSQN